MNKFEQLFSLGHQMSLTGSLYRGGRPGGSPCMVRSNASCVMVTCDPSPLNTDLSWVMLEL